MDVDAALAELLSIAHEHQDELDNEEVSNDADTGRMADLVIAVHEWINAGGHLPAAWER